MMKPMLQDPLEFDFAPIRAEEQAKENAGRKAKAIAVRAIKTRSRIETRRVKAEAALAEVLPGRIEDGECYHCLSSGDVDSLSYLAHILQKTKMEHVLISTWCMAMPDVLQIKAWLCASQIGKMDVYVGEIFPNQYAAEYEALCNVIRQYGGRVAVFRNHSKIMTATDGMQGWVIESSANVNTNPRTEQTVITASTKLLVFYRNYFDKIHSFNRNFDEWIAACLPACEDEENFRFAA